MGTAASLPFHLVSLKSREEIAEGTMALRFERPAGWTFKAGQFVDMTLTVHAETDAEGDTRAFSIASAPHEEFLMFATRMRGTAFKRALRSVPLGAEVKIAGPMGNLTLHNNAARPAVFLAGGIGITPFRSIVFRAASEKLAHRIFLFSSNRRPEDAPFLGELEALERQNPNYKFIATMTGMEKSRRVWDGETGLLNEDLLSRYLAATPWPIYYLAGPPGMVKGLRETLNNAGVDDDDIRAEEFGGY